MESEQKTNEEKGCCGKSRCCCCKTVMALVLLLIGGAVGFFMGKYCGRGMCPISSATPAVQTPAK